jgi:parallel beta-helix repeat protein
MKTFRLILLLVLLSPVAQAKTLYFTPSTSYQVAEALENLKSGDRVLFARGQYSFPDGLKIQNVSNVVVAGQGRVDIVVTNLNADVISLEGCERVQIKGLRARHERPAKEYECEGAVIRLRSCQDIFIANNRLNGCGAAGVFAMDSKGVVVYENRIFNNTFAGVWLQDSSATIHRNKIYRNASAVITYGKCSASMTENTVEKNRGNIFNSTSFFQEMTGER